MMCVNRVIEEKAVLYSRKILIKIAINHMPDKTNITSGN